MENTSNSSKDKELFEKGLQLYSERKYQDALSCFQKLSHPKMKIMKDFHCGLCLIQLGEFEAGLNEYRKIREIPEESEGVPSSQLMYNLYINMGSVLHILGRRKQSKELYEEAKTCYSTALQIKDTDARIWNNFGNVHLDLGEYDLATEKFIKAIQLDDEFPEAHYSFSLVYEFTNRYEQAIEQLLLALKFKPQQKLILNRITALYFGLHQFEKAKEYALKSVQFYPEDLTTNKNLTLILYNLEDYTGAYQYYQKLQQLNPNFDEPELRTIFQEIERYHNKKE